MRLAFSRDGLPEVASINLSRACAYAGIPRAALCRQARSTAEGILGIGDKTPATAYGEVCIVSNKP